MLYTIEGEKITKVAYESKFKDRMNYISKQDYDVIVDALNEIIDKSDVHTSSWIPGHNWIGTLFEPIWKACKCNNEEAAKFYGQILYKVMMDRPEKWYFGKYPHAKGKTYFRV